MTIESDAPLIEALVQLCDEFCQLHRVHGPSASQVVQDLTGLYHLTEAGAEAQAKIPIEPQRYRSLLAQAETMIKRHYGVTQLDNDILEELLETMWNLEEIAND